MKTHGERRPPTKEYQAWCHMKKRCYNYNDPQFMDYGGRGIYVCKRWLNSYEKFLSDVGRAPSKYHSIDRIKVNGNYTPKNVKWSTRDEQNNNKRNSIIIELGGIKKSLQQWCNEYGISRETVKHRLKTNWPIDLVFTHNPYTGNRINKKQKLSFYKNNEL